MSQETSTRTTTAEAATQNSDEAQNTLWHTLPADEVLSRLNATREGLSDADASTRLEEHGRNTLPQREPPTLASIILHQFLNPLIYILVAAGVVSAALGDWKDALFIFAVILLNAALGTYQEWRAEQGAAALQDLLKVTAKVRRAGATREIDGEELVPGDVVLLESGDRVPADLRLLEANSLETDESFLTGESVAARKSIDAQPEDKAVVGDRDNMAFAGATVMKGRASGVVVTTGIETEIGHIAQATSGGEVVKPPLVLRMERFVRHITFIILGAIAILAVVSFLRGMPPREIFFLAVALAVSAIPEGLPVAITVALSIGVARMARRNAIVRKMAAVEGLGSCTFIGSDKTGTLTMNQQTVQQIWMPGGAAAHVSQESESSDIVTGSVTGENDEALTDEQRSHLERVTRAVILCNEATLTQQDGDWKQSGDAMDIALLAFAHKAGIDPETVRAETTIVSEIPFESERKYAATFYREGDDNRVLVALKGATETVLGFCRSSSDGELDVAHIEGEALRLAGEGYRVLAIAQGQVSGDVPQQVEEGDLPPLEFLGLAAFIDPLRPEAREAVQRCRDAGIEVAMITGDHPATASAIARDLGLAGANEEAVTGRDLDQIGAPDSPKFDKKVASSHVFARVSPLQKLHIVESLRRQGHFVAVTGDGVNDAPAMRAAHIGVAMGSGTDVAKDAASIIVTDDNFASIVRGVEEGRFAYDNIRKVIYLLISAGAAEILLFMLAVAMGTPLPLLPVQILWLNLVTNGIQDVALAFEKGEPDAMKRKPRSPDEGIFNRLMIMQTVLSGVVMGALGFAVWWFLLRQSLEEAQARNLLFLFFVLFQNYHVFNCRSEQESAFRIPLRRNLLLVAGVALALGLHLLAMQLAFTQDLLRVAPVSLNEFFTLLLLASSVLWIMEIVKWLQRRSVAAKENGGVLTRVK